VNTNPTRHPPSPWLNSLVQQQGKLILAIPVSCLATSLSIFGWLQVKTTKAESWVQHTQQVRLEAQRLLTTLLDAETGVQGYDITRHRKFLVPYETADAQIPQSLNQLSQLVADNPSQTQRIGEIRVLATARFRLLQENLQLVERQPELVIGSAELSSQLLQGKEAMDRTIEKIEQFIAQEEHLQIQRNQKLSRQQQLTWIVVSLSAGIGIGGSLLAAYLLNRQGEKLRERERNLRESEARYRVLIENFPNGAVFLFDSQLRYLVAGGTRLAPVGLSPEQLEGKSIWDVLPAETCEAIAPLYQKAIAGHPSILEIPDADHIYLMYTLPIRNESGEVFAGMVMTQDITERKNSEQRLYQLNRALRTLGECNQALVRATDEPTLLQDICQIIVEFGGYHSVWIGFVEQDEAKTVRPVAQAQCDPEYLKSLQISWADTARGRGPTGTAIRTGQISIAQNILTDPNYLSWREVARQRGYASSIALPLIIFESSGLSSQLNDATQDSKEPGLSDLSVVKQNLSKKPPLPTQNSFCLGALNIYATEPNAFDEAEVKLLTELANDLAYGIVALRTKIEHQQTEAILRDSEAKFRAFLESASEAIIVTNNHGEIVVFNAKAEELFGYDHAEVCGRTVEFLMPERYHQQHPQHRAAYQAQPSKRSMSQTKNLFAKRQDGTEFPIEAGLSAIQTKDGTFVMTFITDITERKRAEEEIRRLNQDLEKRAIESESRYQQIVELAEEGIWVIDSNSQITYVNQAMAKMLGFTESEMLGHPIWDLMNETDYQLAISNIERRQKGAAEKHEFQLKAKDGKLVWTYMSMSPVFDENDQLLWSCALVYDITEQKQADEQLRQSSERISLANAELARATRLKDEFLANMSHELRTPLNAILGLTEALQEEVYGPLTARQRKSLGTVEQSGQHLLELINDILDLSKIESGKMELQIQPVSLGSLCESSLTFVKQQAHQKKIKLNFQIVEGLGKVQLDERRIRQVLVNLLSNAVKFTPEGGEVRVEVAVDPDCEILQLRVIDTGIGIAPENIDRLFKPFVQLDSSLSRRYAGTGLGLSLVRRIIELHSGSISLESEVGKGSKFTVTLPWKESDRMLLGVNEVETTLVELPTIRQALIVEDSETAAKQIARYLTELGAAINISPQGEGTLEAVLKSQPDVIILDLLLPNLSGWEVLAQLKGNPLTAAIPVLVISVVDERSQALALGATEYLLKPISRQKFHSTLSKIFSTVAQHRDHQTSNVMPETEQRLPLILVAEDNEANISTLLDYLEVQGLRVSLARNGIEAVQMAKQQKPDLILMDIQMPEMDGLEATRQIRGAADLTNVPIIALTALAMPGDREKCLAAGANEYLTKPVGLKKLVNIITQYISDES